MKKVFAILAALCLCFGAKADEGMWLVNLVGKTCGKDMKAAGCRLSPEEIYSVNHSSLKDAVVMLGDFCTAEMISSEGLLVTNHHCGYEAIQKLSGVDHDYLKDGYWAMSRSEELPADGLSVSFLEAIEDVTEAMRAVYDDALEFYRDSTNALMYAIEAREEAARKYSELSQERYPGCMIEVIPFYADNVWYLVAYRRYYDVRFVGAPPSSIGKFGGETDNWEWPRHTGDFSMFRVYAAPDGSPAQYSPDNVPMHPRRNLKVSLKGVQEGDFAMIMGFPGSTTRYQTAAQIQSQLDLNDVIISAFTLREDILREDMLADPAVKIKYASKFAQSTNYSKNCIGVKQAAKKLRILDRARETEEEFNAWVSRKAKRRAEYGTVVEDIRRAKDSSAILDIYEYQLYGSLQQIELGLIFMKFISSMVSVECADTLQMMEFAFDTIEEDYKDYDASTDRKCAKALLTWYRDNVNPFFWVALEDKLLNETNIDSLVDVIYDNSAFTSAAALDEMIHCPDAVERIHQDPATILGSALYNSFMGLYMLRDDESNLRHAESLYMKGLMEMNKGRASLYPDANFTMRLTWGNVKSYEPSDGVLYNYYTTLDGVMEKEIPGDPEFSVPSRLKQLYETRDYGEYAMEDSRMPVCFLTTNDITGGNSGSPVLNADGELIGLAFDGNWEAMSGDIIFENQLQRCINVDIRYVLFIIDKFAGAGYLIDEMDIVR